jgi:hypothetical protein
LARERTWPVSENVGLPETAFPSVTERPFPDVWSVRATTEEAVSFAIMPVEALSRLPEALLRVIR